MDAFWWAILTACAYFRHLPFDRFFSGRIDIQRSGHTCQANRRPSGGFRDLASQIKGEGLEVFSRTL